MHHLTWRYLGWRQLTWRHAVRGRLAHRLGGAFVLGLASATAAHAQATINDCEKIQAADAYNQCLAKFGPTSKVKNLAPERPGDVKSSSEEAAAGAGAPKGGVRAGVTPGASEAKPARARASRRAGRVRSVRRGRAVRRSGGRKRMTFSVGRRRHR